MAAGVKYIDVVAGCKLDTPFCTVVTRSANACALAGPGCAGPIATIAIILPLPEAARWSHDARPWSGQVRPGARSLGHRTWRGCLRRWFRWIGPFRCNVYRWKADRWEWAARGRGCCDGRLRICMALQVFNLAGTQRINVLAICNAGINYI